MSSRTDTGWRCSGPQKEGASPIASFQETCSKFTKAHRRDCQQLAYWTVPSWSEAKECTLTGWDAHAEWGSHAWLMWGKTQKCFKLGSKILSVVRACCLVINHFHTDCLMQKGCWARCCAGQLKSLPYVTQAKGEGERERKGLQIKASKDSLFCSTSASAGEGREMLHRHKLGEHSKLIIKRHDITRRAYESS